MFLHRWEASEFLRKVFLVAMAVFVADTRTNLIYTTIFAILALLFMVVYKPYASKSNQLFATQLLGLVAAVGFSGMIIFERQQREEYVSALESDADDVIAVAGFIVVTLVSLTIVSLLTHVTLVTKRSVSRELARRRAYTHLRMVRAALLNTVRFTKLLGKPLDAQAFWRGNAAGTEPRVDEAMSPRGMHNPLQSPNAQSNLAGLMTRTPTPASSSRGSRSRGRRGKLRGRGRGRAAGRTKDSPHPGDGSASAAGNARGATNGSGSAATENGGGATHARPAEGAASRTRPTRGAASSARPVGRASRPRRAEGRVRGRGRNRGRGRGRGAAAQQRAQPG